MTSIAEGVQMCMGAFAWIVRLVFLITVSIGNAQAALYYVNGTRVDDSGAATNWATAKRSIQAAINLTRDGDSVIVTNGNYSQGSTVFPGHALPSRVLITNDIVVRSLNGPKETTIHGSGTNNFDTSSAVRCVYMTKGQLIGFTLSSGTTLFSRRRDADDANGGGVNMSRASAVSSLSNCIISTCKAYQGGGAYCARLHNCVVVNSTAIYAGGGINGGVSSDCRLSNNSALTGGGSAYGVLNNCTIARNQATQVGGGTFRGTLRNCIVWGNTASGSNDQIFNYCLSTFNYSCTFPQPSTGNYNICSDPQFVDMSANNFRLRSGSSCLDAGNNDYLCHSVDAAGNARLQDATVDMGAYEGPIEGACIDVKVEGLGLVMPSSVQIVQPETEVSFIAKPNPRPFIAFYTNGVFATAETNFTWRGVLTDSVLQVVFKTATWYADTSRSNDNGDGTTWATAKKTIQAAVNLATNGDTVVVADGVYSIGQSVTPGGLSSNRLVITKPITVRSQNGPEGAIIEGYGETSSKTAVRGVYMSSGVLDGFTIRNGVASFFSGSVSDFDGIGGGVSMYNSLPNALVRNCIITFCKASRFGGGVAYGTIEASDLCNNSSRERGGGAYNCSITDSLLHSNTVSGMGNGGGAYGCSLERCEVKDNVSTQFGGGGLASSTANMCLISGNATCTEGGGVLGGTLNNCVVRNNSVYEAGGGGASYASLNNCLLLNNTAQLYPQFGGHGGGASFCVLNNCTVWGNKSFYPGGGVFNCTLNNSIVWSNTVAGVVTNFDLTSSFTNCCTWPLPAVGKSNISAPPLFVSEETGDFRLCLNSPCVNSGSNIFVTTFFDLLGSQRIIGNIVDMGAYELALQHTSTTVPVPCTWIDQYPNILEEYGGDYTKAAEGDYDCDSLSAWQEYVVGSDPTDGLSGFRAGIEMIEGNPVVSWHPDLGFSRKYTVQGRSACMNEEWSATNSASRFFRVLVDMP